MKSSLFTLPQPPATSSLLGPNIHLNLFQVTTIIQSDDLSCFPYTFPRSTGYFMITFLRDYFSFIPDRYYNISCPFWRQSYQSQLTVTENWHPPPNFFPLPFILSTLPDFCSIQTLKPNAMAEWYYSDTSKDPTSKPGMAERKANKDADDYTCN
jgi:hypothetical protein